MTPELVSDAELIIRVRSGDANAMGELYERHREPALRVARATCGDPHLAEDLVSAAFERVHGAISRGAGPDDSFRAYLYTVVRRLASDAGVLKSRERDTDDWTPFEAEMAIGNDAERTLEAQLVAAAFSTLPERQQSVLWYLEVEGLTPVQAAPLFGLSPNATSALAVRARDALRVAYIQAHVSDNPAHVNCVPARRLMGGYLRSSLSQRDAARVEGHLMECDECPLVLEEIKDVGYGLKSVFGPLLIGGGVLGGALSAIAGNGESAMAAAVAGAGATGATVGVAAGAGAASAGGSNGGAGAASGASKQSMNVAIAAASVLAVLGIGTVVSAAVTTSPAESAIAPPAAIAAPAPVAPSTPPPVMPTPTPTPTPTPNPPPPPSAPVAPAPVVDPVPPPPAPQDLPSIAALTIDFTEDAQQPDLSWLGRILVTATNANTWPIDAQLRVTLPSGLTVDPGQPLDGVADWTCSALSVSPMTCTSSAIPASGTVHLTIPVRIDEAALGSRPTANVTVSRS